VSTFALVLYLLSADGTERPDVAVTGMSDLACAAAAYDLLSREPLPELVLAPWRDELLLAERDIAHEQELAALSARRRQEAAA
jgi:hypothetical protein